MIGGGIYPGMITATVGTALLIAVVATLDRDRAPAAALRVVVRGAPRSRTPASRSAWFHQIPTGNELVLDTVAADYWRALYVATLALIVVLPRRRAARATRSATGCASPRSSRKARASSRSGSAAAGSTGCGAEPGQFFLWRFLDARPLVDGASVLALGGARRALAADHRQGARRPHARGSRRCPSGTRVLAEGPFGVFTERRGAARKVLLIAGGIGITPVRALRRAMRRRRRRRSTASLARGRARLPRRARASSRRPGIAALRRRRPRERRGRAAARRPTTCASSCPTSPSATSTSAARPAMTDAIEPQRPRAPASRAVTSTSNASPSSRERSSRHAKSSHRSCSARRRSPCRADAVAAADAATTAPKKKVVDGDEDVHRPAGERRPLGRRPGHARRQEDDHDRRHEEDGEAARSRRSRCRSTRTTPTAPSSSTSRRCRCLIQEMLQAQFNPNIQLVSRRDRHERRRSRSRCRPALLAARRSRLSARASSTSWACRSSSTSATTTTTRGARGGLRLVRCGRRDVQHVQGRQRDQPPQPRRARARGRASGRARGARPLRGAARGDRRLLRRARRSATARSVRARQGLVGRPGGGDPRASRRARTTRSTPAATSASRRRAARAGWRVGIQHPLERARRSPRSSRATDLAVATSGAYARGEHVVDPHTGARAGRRPVGDDHRPRPRDRGRVRDRGVRDGRARGPHWTARLRGYEAMTILADGGCSRRPAFRPRKAGRRRLRRRPAGVGRGYFDGWKACARS